MNRSSEDPWDPDSTKTWITGHQIPISSIIPMTADPDPRIIPMTVPQIRGRLRRKTEETP